MNRTPRTVIFTGRSGCGKGTQAALLEKSIRSAEPQAPLVHIETGKLFREFIKGDNYTHRLSKDIYEAGGLQPEFLTVHLWSDFFVANMVADAGLIIDGTPRKLNEACVLDSAMKFYGRGKVAVVLLNVSRQWSKERMLERHRTDDKDRDIEARLDWFDSEVVPAIDFFRSNASDYDFHDISGERPIAEIHSEIAALFGLPPVHE